MRTLRWIGASCIVLATFACKSNESAAPTSANGATSAATPPSAPAKGASAVKPLDKGDRAPDFRLEGSDGKQHALADHAGKQVVVIAWFPKAFTGG
jgi:hypothetical protein